MVSPRLRGAAVVVALSVALSGCGSVHPGAAAQVGDVSISDNELQQTTQGFCDLIDTINLAQQGTNPPVPLRTALLSALNTLVTGEALDQLASRNEVTVTDAEVQRWIDGLPLDFSQVPKGRAASLRQVTELVGRNTLLVQKLGQTAYEAQSPGGQTPPPDQIQRLGQQVVTQYLDRVGVETDPRYGQALDTQRDPGTGSLSVAVSDEGVAGRSVPQASNNLPPNEECS